MSNDEEIGQRYTAIFVFFDPQHRENFFKCLGLKLEEGEFYQDAIIMNMIEKEDEMKEFFENGELNTEEDSEESAAGDYDG